MASATWWAFLLPGGFSLRGVGDRTLAGRTKPSLTSFFFGVLGIILGGRIGYMLFYGHAQIADNPMVIFKTWQGGMSFHGGMIGVLIAIWIYARKYRRSFFEVTDFIAPSIPLGLGCGRIGNFINGELPGRVTEVSWAAIYPGEVIARHPSSLYQAVLEGPVLFAILWIFAARPRPVMAISGLFLLGYGVFRFFSELFRQPDSHLGFVAFDWLTQGQLLSMPMVLFGVAFLVISYQRSRI